MKNDEDNFSAFAWRASIPLCDDLYLGMQAQNIAIVDLSVVRPLERGGLDEFYKNDRFPIATKALLPALSQMWIFALYEFLRTWRQRARTLISFSDTLAKKKIDERESYLTEVIKKIEEKAKHVRVAPVFYINHAARLADGDFIKAIVAYKECTDSLFREVELVRMSLAKHEIAGPDKFIAEAPGYTGVSTLTGSAYWQLALADGTVTIVDRQRIANRFLGFAQLEEHEDDKELENQEEKPKRKRRRGKRGGKRRRTLKAKARDS